MRNCMSRHISVQTTSAIVNGGFCYDLARDLANLKDRIDSGTSGNQDSMLIQVVARWKLSKKSEISGKTWKRAK